jgi:putative FmdB family regulatory protein
VPLYEYQCPKCGRFELIRKFSDDLLTKCPTCGSDVQKLLSAPAIQFKGTGWYITDYARKSDGKGKSEGGSEGAKSEGAKSEGSKSEGSKSEGAKGESAKSEGSNRESSKGEGSKGEGSKGEGSKGESSKDTGRSSGDGKAAAAATTTATKDSGGSKSS